MKEAEYKENDKIYETIKTDYIVDHKTIKYEKMASIMATNQIGMTVLFRYPNPNGRNCPSGLYAKPGFTW